MGSVPDGIRLAHEGQPVAPHDVWGAWNLDPLLLAGLVLAATAYARGSGRDTLRGPNRRRGTACYALALGALAAALVSPLEAASRSLASAHMVQHVILTMVVAPLLVVAAPIRRLLLGSPVAVLRAAAGWTRRMSRGAAVRLLGHPATGALGHVTALWFWHASGPYDAALRSPALHVVEHAMLVATALLFWRLVVGPRGYGALSAGAGVLLVFGMAVQGVLLAALLTFAPRPWYTGYATTTAAWGLDPLADQQLAGVIMWVPAGLLQTAIGMTLFVSWLRAEERDDLAV